MINLPIDRFSNGIYYLSGPADYRKKEELYLKVREKEGRIYDDDSTKLLPFISRGHKHYNEWRLRKITADKLVKHFSRYSSLSILDVGAGNCWLSNFISEKTENSVFATDLNETELKQGARVFNNNKKLKFFYGNILEDIFDGQLFDAVLFISSIQYFPDLTKTIKKALTFIKPDGYIIIADSKFYNKEEIPYAKARTEKYYEELGFSEAVQYYFHHSYKDLNKFEIEILRDESLLNKIFIKTGLKMTSPFPFIKIYKQ